MSTSARDTNPMLSGMGPAAYADRADVPDLTVEGHAKIVPLRTAPTFFIEPRDPDPRGMSVVGTDGVEAGIVTDLWIDRAEPQLRYFEITLNNGGRTVLLPATFAKVDARRGTVKVASILASQFADVPAIAHAERITLREEDRVMAYYASGNLYRTPDRREPLL
jgi:photosynthetic reaction center H subunit